MILLSLLTDIDRSLAEMNTQSIRLEELSSQKPLGIVQRDHFNGAFVIEPQDFRFINVRMDNLPVGQNICFSADALEPHALYRFLWKAHLPRKTGVNDNRNLPLRRDGLQNHDGFPSGGYFSVDCHELRSV